MLILSALLVCIIGISFLRARRPSRILSFGQVLLVNILAVEFFFYVFLLFQVWQGGNFFLIGQQKFLDALLRLRLAQKVQVEAAGRYSLYRVDPQLGYTVGEDRYIGRYRATNSAGMRSDKEYPLLPNADKLRIATFGDSFVFCDAELTQNCWSYFLEKMFKNVEVLNFGVSGYGLGQSYLRYLKDGLKFRPDIVFINYTRITNRDRLSPYELINAGSLRDAYQYRVVFGVADGELIHRPTNPFDLFDERFRDIMIYQPLGLSEKKGFWNSQWVALSNVGLYLRTVFYKKELLRHVQKEYEQLEVNYKILESLITMAEAQGSTVFFMSQDPSGLPEVIRGLLAKHAQRIVYIQGPENEFFSARFKALGYEREKILNNTNHYNAVGNRIYAEVVGITLMSREWGEGKRRFRFDKEQQVFVNVGK